MDAPYRSINAYQRAHRLKHGCPICRARVTSRTKVASDGTILGTFDACTNYGQGDIDDCRYHINNVGKPDMREIAFGPALPMGPADVSRLIVVPFPKKKIDLTRFHTRHLLGIMQAHHRNESQMYSVCWCGDSGCDYGFRRHFRNLADYYSHTVINPAFFGYPDNDQSTLPVTVADLKAELSTRPHVPNKREAREIRQKKAQNRR